MSILTRFKRRRRDIPSASRDHPIIADPHVDIEGNDLDSPGTAAWGGHPVIFGTRSAPAVAGNGAPMALEDIPGADSTEVPNPSIGGEPRQSGALGWSRGLNDVVRMASFRGQVLAVRSLGVHPADGPVGFQTRTTAGRFAALNTDFTPDARAAGDLMLPYTG